MTRRVEVSRRGFIAASAALIAGGPLLFPSRAYASRKGSANDRIGIALIGMGIQNRFHLNSFLKRGDTQVLAVCDVDATRLNHARDAVNKHYGNNDCLAAVDYRELLARQDIDAVVISTPDHWHGIQILDAARAGKDIYCEKPLTLTLAEAKASIDAVRKHKRVLQTGSQQRTEHEGRFRRACEYARAGRIGDILAVHAGLGTSSVWCDLPAEEPEPGLDWDRWLGPAPMRPYNAILSPRGVHNHYPNWRLYREYSGGMMTDWGAHHFDIAQWALNADDSGPVEVLPPAKEGATHGARFRYANGVTLTHGGPFGVTIIGTSGMIYVTREGIASTPARVLEQPLTDADPRLPAPRSHIDDWIERIRDRGQCICNEEVGARSVAVCHLGNLAYWNRRAIHWDPKSWAFTGDSAPHAAEWMDNPRRAGYELPTI
ncbi:MAG: Gfo/Idh/MocA family oxidoreductase [Phycisphaeraceae bacterium]|nr:Gfo/Idh/MocA family oxidoreductase [Phycisphaeraceae bacterium]